MSNGGRNQRRIDPVSGSWPLVLLDLVVVVTLVSLAKAVSDRIGSPTTRWAAFVVLTALLLLVLVAVPLRVMLQRQRRGMRRATQLAREQAVTDPLTGLLNRRSLDEVVHSLLRDRVPFSVSICDLDDFQDLNDTEDRNDTDGGDDSLRVFADTLRHVVRKGDFVARLGGEQFVVVLPESVKRHGLEVLERARVHLRIRLAIDPVPAFTFSAGVADTGEMKGWAQLLRLADQRLLAAKRAGRDHVLEPTAQEVE